MATEHRQSVQEQITSSTDLSDTDKQVVADLVLDTEKQLKGININDDDQYPVQFNHRFIKWMYYLIFSSNRRAKAIRKSVDDDPELDLFSFCCSIAELYASISTMFHPASTIIYKNAVTSDDIMNTFRVDMEEHDVITLESAEILLNTGIPKAEK